MREGNGQDKQGMISLMSAALCLMIQSSVLNGIAPVDVDSEVELLLD